MNTTDYFPDYTEVGYTKKTFGVHGDLRIFVEDSYIDSLLSAKHCFFLLKGCLVPYFIESASENLIRFESTSNPEDAHTIISKSIFLHNDQLIQSEENTTDDLAYLSEYTIIDDDQNQAVGTIKEIVSYPQQEIAIILYRDSEYMLPLHPENVMNIDEESKTIRVQIPEGLLDLNQ